ncbi:MAG: efflux RND transporter periplasmic adaptor subunit [Thermodesulfobacteriota bacterium]
MKRLALVGVAVAVTISLYMVLGRSAPEETKFKYVTVPVERGTLRSEVMCTGSLTPLNQVLVGSQVSGTIKKLYADFESKVEKGQLIALIDPAIYDAKAAQARADLEAAKAALHRAEVTSQDELRTLRRKEMLFEKQSISESEIDQTRARADGAVAQVDVERARVVQMEARLTEAELQLKYTRIEAPVDGVVTARSVDEGQTVAATFQAPVLFTIAEDLTLMEVHANVDESDIGRVRVRQKGSFTVPAFPEEPFDAEVTQIRNDPKIEQNVVTYIVVLKVDNRELKLRPGMTANIRILLEEAQEALMIPEQACRFSPSATSLRAAGAPTLPPLKEGEKRCWKVEKGNKIYPVTVKTGVVGLERTQIISDALREGDKIAVDEVRTQPAGPKASGLRIRF